MTLIPLHRLLIDKRADDHVVAIRNGLSITFSRLRNDVAAAAKRFSGIRAAALVCQDSYNFCVGFFGLLHANARVVLPQNNKTEFDLLINDAEIEKGGNESATLAPLDPNAMMINVFTSGSSGTPQKIGKNLAGLEREIGVLESLWGTAVGNGPVYATVPHQHIYGLTFKLLWPLSSGRPFVSEIYSLWEDLLAGIAPRAILVSSPAHLSRAKGLSPLPEMQRLKAVFSAGSPLSADARRESEVILGCAPREIFGSTETGAIATRSSATEIWRVLPGIEHSINGDGQLCLRTPFAGAEWITTNDLAEPAPDGFLFRGRADTIVKIEGKRVSLAAAEQALMRHPEIEKAVVTIIPGETERLAAAVVLSPEGQKICAEMGTFRFGRFLRQRLAPTEDAASIPRLWRFVEELPIQPLGKRRAADIIALFSDAS